MTDDLTDKLTVLTDDRPEPVDPAAPIRLRIARRRRRRGATVVVASAAAVTAVALGTGPVVGSLHASPGPSVAGFPTAPSQLPSKKPTPATPSSAPSSSHTPSQVPVKPGSNLGDSKTKLPAPWSAERFTKMPDANAYRPHAYYLAKYTIPTESVGVLAFSRDACIVTDEGPANSFGRPYSCFTLKPGQRSAFATATASTREKSGVKMNYTLVFGVVPLDARKVRVTAAGRTYLTDAIGTPATDKLRFFSVLVPAMDANVTAVTPLNAAGRLAAAPTR
ncbi:hypothetical protein AB0E69_18835 [Kribbella sp. NPDC026611]|uniref:hypothetical protein n=1 Tax=Kribbella sp. NPDC026611 TaxID=3154911 RepID=UPI00340339E5